MFGIGVGIRVGGYTAVSSGGYDPDAQAFFDRVTTAGGTLTTTEKNATNQLVLDMKSAGIWTAMKAVYPMVGASAAACAQNLKSSSFTGTFSSGWTFASTGVTPNGTSAYMDTNFIPASNLTINDQSYSVYSRSQTAAGTKRELGVNYFGEIGVIIKYNSDLFYPLIGGGTYPNVSNTNSRGHYIANRIDGTNIKGYKNGSLVVNATQNALLPTTYSIYIGSRNDNGVANEYSDRELAFAHLGQGLTNTQASNFYTAVQAFQASLSRSV